MANTRVKLEFAHSIIKNVECRTLSNNVTECVSSVRLLPVFKLDDRLFGLVFKSDNINVVFIPQRIQKTNTLNDSLNIARELANYVFKYTLGNNLNLIMTSEHTYEGAIKSEIILDLVDFDVIRKCMFKSPYKLKIIRLGPTEDYNECYDTALQYIMNKYSTYESIETLLNMF